jgi:glycosyltransferase involved in cell wall biosynthesis
MTILIIETESVGHYLVGYIKYILRYFHTTKFKIIILTTVEASKHPSFEILKKENNNIKLEYIEKIALKKKNTIALIFYQVKFYFLVKNKFKILNSKYKFNLVFLNSFERFDKAISFFGTPFQKTQFSGIFLGLKFHLKKYNIFSSGRLDFISEFLFKRLLQFSTLKTILTNDFFLEQYAKKNKFMNYNKINFLHEPKEFNYSFKKSLARKHLNILSECKLLLVYGALIESKGIKELINALLHPNISNNVAVALVGEQSQEIRLFLSSDVVNNLINSKKLYIFDGWQNEINEAKIFSACDIVWIGYKNYPIPSGVLYQAAVKILPIIASNEGIINYFNKKYKLGYTVDINNTLDIVNKINKICKKRNYQSFAKNIQIFKKNAKPNLWIKKFDKLVIR